MLYTSQYNFKLLFKQYINFYCQMISCCLMGNQVEMFLFC
ncbi:conserved hypothetical protein [Xenorhabdus nematophila F1]|uniref:Uncharacterized protein n=1 Tax=Xenorhabdus nematophila (strain ATCC 19061 / DSM 3370 / CCUG 14189 / LMG 1036 / NCIMB 9965 / AN6) TaxID=406817 RepID=D3VFX1_XENNA|nr:hypothetical protein XNC1_4615 [Xenorhabdus nematophila ATCC 19061]CCW32779.1 conserved hypothetical protein [Xenorhabdus nematophila F1]CEK25444.1 hypothetical protein XNC2_4457 [Xenorhabdus nematophila AN6/1]